MPIRHTIWKVSDRPERLSSALLASEQALEEMIVSDCGILSDQWMLIGRQERTPYSGRIDLLALAPDSSLVLIELKRDQTPRDVVAQSIDYAAWLEELEPSDITEIYRRFKPNHSLEQDFKERFGEPLDEEGLRRHQIVIVAGSLDGSTERIIKYLSQRGLAINVMQFQVFSHGAEQLLSRAWLLDTAEVQVNVESSRNREKEPWNGEFYVNFGHGDSRSWPEAVRFGFVSAGGGAWYSNTLRLLSPGDRVWVKSPPDYGFVGVGLVTGYREPLLSFEVDSAEGRVAALTALKQGHYHKDLKDDPEKCEYFVSVQWLQTVAVEDSLREAGLFGNQSTVCRPTVPKWRTTVERLKQFFPNHTDAGSATRRTKTLSSATP
jgi:hypothetical protein